MNLGAEPKKVAVLGLLLAGAAITLYFNVFSSDSPAPGRVARPAAAVTSGANPAQPNPSPPRRRERAKTAVGEFKPRQGAARPEDRADPASIDPALRLDLLDKVQGVEPGEAARNLFQYGVAVAVVVKPVDLPKNPPRIAVNQPPAPPFPPDPDPFTLAAPKAPPMTFKYYGYKTLKSTGRKQAFLLDGDEIIIAGENDPVKSARYKVVRIGINSITIEDTQFKSTQTLPLQEENAA